MWSEVRAEMDAGRVSCPMELQSLDLRSVLLVGCFEIREKRGEKLQVKDIHNFRRNKVNSFSQLFEKLHYDHFGHMLAALQVVAHSDRFKDWSHVVPIMGKADFKSAFKTLGVVEDHQWMCWVVVFNPSLGR